MSALQAIRKALLHVRLADWAAFVWQEFLQLLHLQNTETIDWSDFFTPERSVATVEG